MPLLRAELKREEDWRSWVQDVSLHKSPRRKRRERRHWQGTELTEDGVLRRFNEPPSPVRRVDVGFFSSSSIATLISSTQSSKEGL